MTHSSDSTDILVVGSDPGYVTESVAGLREAGWTAIGTVGPWEVLSLVAQRPCSLILTDKALERVGLIDFGDFLREDPILKDIPIVSFSRESQQPIELVALARTVLSPSFPTEGASSRNTRFVRRRKPDSVPA